MSRFWSSLTHSLQPYVPGEQPRIADLVKLNTNESPYPPSPRALAAILRPGGRLLLGWNTDKIADPVAAGLTAPWFMPTPFAGQAPRVTFDEVTHVYDALVRTDAAV